MSSVDFVMPVYHEAENIRPAVEALAKCTDAPKRLLAVYDDEDDPTVAVLQKLSARYPWVCPVHNQVGAGVVGAVVTGFQAATAENVIVTMADLSDDLSVVPAMLRLLSEEGFDVVCASRYMPGGAQLGGPWLKGQLSRWAGKSLHWLSGLPSRDATNAFRGYRRSVLERVSIESTGGFEFTLELTAKAFLMGYRITEVPATWRDRTEGASNFRLWSWIPKYLYWYGYLLSHGMRRRLRRAVKAES